jgi:hypothetical protein
MPRKTDSQQTTNAIIAQSIKNLDEKVTEGFRIMHEKQDHTNGKVLKAGADIVDLQKVDIGLDNKFRYNRVIWYLFTTAIGAIITLASYILFNPK